MKAPHFYTRTHAKWILAGEHAVLRGHPAIVYPIKSYAFNLNYIDVPSHLEVNISGQNVEQHQPVFINLLKYGLEKVGEPLTQLKGQFNLDSNIPIGVGLGASAALCTAVARWFLWKGYIKETQTYEFARQLEHYFHGKSSGIDIAGATADSGLYFKINEEHEQINLAWQPYWYLSYCGEVGLTAECVQKVSTLWADNPELAASIDADMERAVIMARNALQHMTVNHLYELADAINLAKNCFQQWGLTEGRMGQHLSDLLGAGALAVKPTGAGNGGYVLSLWRDLTLPKLPFALELV